MRKTLLFILGITLLALPLAAQPVMELTPMIGYTLGGSFDEFGLPDSVIESANINDGMSYGLIFGIGSEANQFEINWTRHDSDVEGHGGQAEGIKTDYTNDNFQFGWTGYAMVDGPTKPFLNVGLGFSDISIGGESGDTRFSWALGAGVKHDLNDRLALRAQVRWIPTYVNTDDAYVVCDPWYGFCYTVGDDNYINQTEIAAGLVIKLGRR